MTKEAVTATVVVEHVLNALEQERAAGHAGCGGGDAAECAAQAAAKEALARGLCRGLLYWLSLRRHLHGGRLLGRESRVGCRAVGVAAPVVGRIHERRTAAGLRRLQLVLHRGDLGLRRCQRLSD